MFGCATRSITGPASPPSMTLKAIAAMSRYADAATRTVAPSAVSQTDCLAWLVSSCSDRRRLTRSLVSRPNNKPAAVRHALRPASVSRFGWSAVSPSRPADRHRATRSGGQDWPQATVRREAVLTVASTARGLNRSEALLPCCRQLHYAHIRYESETTPLRGYRPAQALGYAHISCRVRIGIRKRLRAYDAVRFGSLRQPEDT